MDYRIKAIEAPKNWRDLKPHPLSALTTFGAGISTEHLADHMREHGYDDSEPLVLLDGQIFDGRHRHVAAQEADVKPTFALFSGNALAYAKKKMLRQHLNESQRAMYAAALIKAGKENESANLPTSQTEAAEALNVSTRSVGDAVIVTESGGEELMEQVNAGETPVSVAADITRTVRCKRCTRLNINKADCGSCEEARAKAAKAPKPKGGGSRKKRGTKPKTQPKGDAYEGDEKPKGALTCTACAGKGWITKETRDELWDAIVEITGADSKVNGPRIGKLCKLLMSADPPYTAEDIRKLPAVVKKRWPNLNYSFHLASIERFIGWVRNDAPQGTSLFDGLKQFLAESQK